MRSFAIFLGLIALGLAGIAALGYPGWLLTQAMGLDFKFHRVASRIAMLVLLAGFVLAARRLRVADRRSLGYGLPARQFMAEAGKAVVLGVVLMLPVLMTMVALDMRELKAGVAPDAAGWLKLALMGLGSGLAVALIEETFLRGAMQTAITRESGATLAILLTALLYAATHFIGRYRIAAADVHAGSGLDMLAGALASFTHPLGILDAFLCLTAVGILLGMVRQLTGNIAACIGLHAGWVAVIYVVRETSERNPHGPANWLMSDYDGFIGWMVLGWTLAIGWALWWWYGRSGVVVSGRENDRVD
ncbi:MAG TPA: CPBP family intramembrane glutamic endopeptidase [Steroidobacteraceae bacterium]|jgi:membrane protease YdiL (CAAX protease family)|nr:CPBP family intramembrane glutamic endopeptidase [Steroidobacteraceae bacterium]